MTKLSPVHPSSDVTLARLAKLLVLAWGALWVMAAHLADACDGVNGTLSRLVTGSTLAVDGGRSMGGYGL